MSDTVLVSTHDLPRAGEIRAALRDTRYRVELVTPDEDVSGIDDAVLLVVTAPPRDARALVGSARGVLGIPVLSAAGGAPGDDVDEIAGPVAPADEVALMARRLVERRRLQRETGILGESEAIREVLERIVQFGPVPSTVLITGESGTGKELAARGIHSLSPRRHKAFIAVNVAALTETLLESELFGHEKGAFTGAVDTRKGLFELADGGTIFLDEIGEMPLATQTKLLRVLEQREFLRVGGEKPIRVDVRVIAATNRDLKEQVALREFRRDLYYRLNVLHIHLPPLRERRDDIPVLVREFVKELEERIGRDFPGISPEAMAVLQKHHWPGNIRELRNLVESMVVLAPNRRIEPTDIPDEVRSGSRSLLPVPVRSSRPPERAEDGGERAGPRPELEFIFRTLVDLRVDMDDLRREFEEYREQALHEALPAGMEIRLPGETSGGASGVPGEEIGPGPGEPGAGETVDVGDGSNGLGGAPEPVPDDDTVVVYRPGMTMEDLEREAIQAALAEVDGNRRKAAERLGIGERTLYRKIKRYDLEV